MYKTLIPINTHFNSRIPTALIRPPISQSFLQSNLKKKKKNDF